MGAEGPSLLGISRHPAGGVVGSRPDRRVTFLRGQESNQRNRRGPLPAPWTPGAVVPDLRPLLAFSLEPSSGLSAAWVHTRRPPPLGGAKSRGRGLRGWVFYGGRQRADRTSPPPLSTGTLSGIDAKRPGQWPGLFWRKNRVYLCIGSHFSKFQGFFLIGQSANGTKMEMMANTASRPWDQSSGITWRAETAPPVREPTIRI